MGRGERASRVVELMKIVGLRSEMADRYPHEMSGGQRQRVAIARAIALSPNLVICDEPVSALDISLQAQILNLLVDLQESKGLSYLFVSHDLSVVEHVAHRVVVMYLGCVVEIARNVDLWRRPAHPYTMALIESVPRMKPREWRIEDRQIVAGDIPSPYNPPIGCRFHTRCPRVMPICSRERPKLKEITPHHSVACHLYS
jgi:oligopeptide/dipeptide ABC transporter ATP-binding protein